MGSSDTYLAVWIIIGCALFTVTLIGVFFR